MHKANDVRRGLQGLIDLAAHYKCAILGITHFTKGSAGGATVERVLGSQAFGALARMVIVCATDQTTEDDSRVFMRAKSNIGKDTGGFRYRIEAIQLPGCAVDATRAVWGQPVFGTAREILAAMEEPQGDTELDDKTRECMETMRALLTGAGVASPSRFPPRKYVKAWSQPDMGNARLTAHGSRWVWLWSAPRNSRPEQRGACCHTPKRLRPQRPCCPRPRFHGG